MSSEQHNHCCNNTTFPDSDSAVKPVIRRLPVWSGSLMHLKSGLGGTWLQDYLTLKHKGLANEQAR